MVDHSLTEFLNDLFGGGLGAAAAVAGRMIFHVSEVKKGKRNFFGKALIWDLIIAVCMGIIAEGVTEYLGLSGHVKTALIAVLAYLGPQVIDVVFGMWSRGKK
ncbi:MAG: phage holin family protein [Hyphomicrobiales bacterium]